MNIEYFQDDWRRKIVPTPRWKRFIYKMILPLLSIGAERHLTGEYWHLHPRRVIGRRGLPLEERREWVNRRHPIRGKTLLVQGTGTGWDVVSWARYRPAVIIGIDLFEFDEWPAIVDYVSREYGVEVRFLRASLEELPIAGNSIDLVVSDAVFEHCQDLPSVLRETRRVLCGGGVVYASYGPLWYSAGGDHFSGRGGNDTVYNHIRLDRSEYLEYFETHRKPMEDFQSGGRYVELDLFSKLTTTQYVVEFNRAGFDLDEIILEVTDEGVDFKRRQTEWFEAMLSRGIASDDLLLKANLVILHPKSGVSVLAGIEDP